MNIQFIFYSEKREFFVLFILFSNLFYGELSAQNLYIQQANNGGTRGATTFSDSEIAVWERRNIPVNHGTNSSGKPSYILYYEIDDKEQYCPVICCRLQQIDSDGVSTQPGVFARTYKLSEHLTELYPVSGNGAATIRLREKLSCKHQVSLMNSYLVEQFESDNSQVPFSNGLSSCISGSYHVKLTQ